MGKGLCALIHLLFCAASLQDNRDSAPYKSSHNPSPGAQAEREAAAAQARETLQGLWTALDVVADDIDRQIFLRLLTGPARLHAQSLSKVGSEEL